ncbi:sulfotransferase family protein [Aliifodinibius salicampi]|uniref:Sulfotransferase family protein n=1 Tax=Fodinibius salicampi TaxID=1920655 RepID=A0ABT3Q2X8_9BACT|nr:sulfotransferase family 2 domain-containing protein [Fodinibius salicampi]MCW9714477.1 sulfotransferase family protein [Fodinibius salicampi]
MGLLKRNWEELRLYYRYFCRMLGVPGYQVHQIYLSDQGLIYIPIPKNACTSIKHALHEIEFGKRFDANLPEFSDYREHHDYFKKRPFAFTSVSTLQKRTDTTRFALVRDPVKRLISCYRNRVLDLGDLESSQETLKNEGLPINPDLNTFVLNLVEYRHINKSIEHHSRPQYEFLGETIDYLDRIFTLSEISELEEMLQRFKPGLKLRQRKTGGTDITLDDISREALDAAIEFYKKDYKLLGDYFSPDDLSK